MLVDLTTPAALADKERNLFAHLASLNRVIVAFSGGTDSAYLAWAAHRVLGANAIAMTADSASLPESHSTRSESMPRPTFAGPLGRPAQHDRR